MIDLYYWPTPNGWKISIALEEMGLAYKTFPINIGRGDQFTADFQSVSPNARMPAIVDHEPNDGGQPFALAESGVILRYLAEKSGMFMPEDPRRRYEAEQWLMWQMAHLGPMLGQHGHFALYAEEKIPYAIDRYRTEVLRLFKVLDTRLEGREHICDEYTVVDMACWPWIITYKSQQIDLGEFPQRAPLVRQLEGAPRASTRLRSPEGIQIEPGRRSARRRSPQTHVRKGCRGRTLAAKDGTISDV